LATAVANFTEEETKKQGDAETPDEEIKPGVLAGVDVSFEPDYCEDSEDYPLTSEEVAALKEMCRKAQTRDTPARLIEIIQAWEAALFYRGYQFLIPLRGGGWKIPSEATGYGPSMQIDLSLLPTNIYSSYGQMIISALTRSVPNVRFQANQDSSDAAITSAQSADKFVKVIRRNNDLIVVQTDAARYLWCDGRALYWSRWEVDGQRFGWQEKDQPSNIVPENEPPTEVEESIVAGEEKKEVQEQSTPIVSEDEEAQDNVTGEEAEEELEEATKGRTPNGQEVRTAHGKLECKMVPMAAANLAACDALQFELEVDECRAKGMFPKKADEIHGGQQGQSEATIARLARENVKLGMQSTYVTADSSSRDVTIQRTWCRPSAFMWVDNEATRNSLIKKFPDGVYICYAGETFIWARNENIDDSWAEIQAYSGDGQNRNALGTSMMPAQKRINNWLDLINDYFVRGIPKIYMDNKAFDVQALRQQSNVPGDRVPMKRQGIPVEQLVWAEPKVEAPASLFEFVKEYIGPLCELLTGGYPAISGGQSDTDTFRGMALQRDQALGRLGPTWHNIQNAEARATKNEVRWGSKMRKGTINERIPGGEVIRLEVNDLKSNIACYAESDENFPESYPQKQQRLVGFMQDSAKNPMLGEVLYNPANLVFLKSMVALPELYIPQVLAWEKQLGELELLTKQKPIPNPQIAEAQAMLEKLKKMPNVDQTQLLAVQQEIDQMAKTKPLVSSVTVDGQVEDNETEAMCCWKFMMEREGRKLKRVNPEAFENVRLHFMDHQEAGQQKAAAAPAPSKPPSESINYKDVAANDPGAAAQLLGKGGMTPTTPASPAEPQSSPGVPSAMPALPGPGQASPTTPAK